MEKCVCEKAGKLSSMNKANKIAVKRVIGHRQIDCMTRKNLREGIEEVLFQLSD